MDQAANDSYMKTRIPSVVGTKFSTTWKGRGGKEHMQCTNEISTYYTYRDEGKLLQADSVSTMFYASK